VVQPGLEFAPAQVIQFDMSQPNLLSSVLENHPNLCFEAHSTDYQAPEVYPELGRRNFAILKVGPALTFAWREALYALSHVDQWQNGTSHISELMEGIMTETPHAWHSHYHGKPAHQKLMRHFGLADRIRYYWTNPKARQAVDDLKSRIDTTPPPAPLLSQYLPQATIRRAEALPLPRAETLLVAHVQEALMPYYEGTS
jgi:D-tagatose-1,6-bisphosphate aldolase subunit GatZ/KbaZ